MIVELTKLREWADAEYTYVQPRESNEYFYINRCYVRVAGNYIIKLSMEFNDNNVAHHISCHNLRIAVLYNTVYKEAILGEGMLIYEDRTYCHCFPRAFFPTVFELVNGLITKLWHLLWVHRLYIVIMDLMLTIHYIPYCNSIHPLHKNRLNRVLPQHDPLHALPEEYMTVWITYNYKGDIVERKAFYNTLGGYYNTNDEWVPTPDGIFNVPQYWQNGVPYTLNHYPRVLPHEIIKWKLVTD